MFTLDHHTDDGCIEFLRFSKAQIKELADLLEIPSKFRYQFEAPPTTALSLVLYRMSWPLQHKQAIEFFGHSMTWLSTVFNDVGIHIQKKFGERMFWDVNQLTPHALTRYCLAIKSKGEPSSKIWGFVDGTYRVMCRSSPAVADQAWFYTGYKKAHTMQFQGISTPDGLICSASGPWEGRTSDWGMWIKSGIQEKLIEHAINIRGEELFIYGDGAYGLQRGVMGSYCALPNIPLTVNQ